ncbi:hypothetical protein BCR42DRAFT_373967 [Absidia repens]|uniref:P-loop containing nucleoside triphosphate hydrolase protein n=1 Tax=Absidia repens TaxID=90262 RepID=A0A1X2II47_9FUNG|nr:hypothetical protein BCR42DRAFT_373967 [Absidia repens]
MVDHANYLQRAWTNTAVTPFFREIFLDSAIPLFFLVWSLGAIVTVTRRYRMPSSALDPPLKNSACFTQSYGATSNNNGLEGQDQQHTGNDMPNTELYDYEEKSTQGTLYSRLRILALAQCIIYCNTLAKVYCGLYSFDPLVEGTATSLLVMYSVQSLLWIYCFVLSLLNLVLLRKAAPIADKICQQLNLMYLVHFLTGLGRLYSFYAVYNLSNVSTGYSVSFYTTAISLVVLVFIATEERHSPEEPIITDTGRTLSGERWASPYSLAMFSWVTVIMKLGYKQTIHECDLIELPAANRAKNILYEYRQNKQSSMFLSLVYTFRWLLVSQAFYSLLWVIASFGPALFLNLIIKYIEEPQAQEPGLTGYLFVVGLFFASVSKSLLMQQSLYIGRTLDIRIKSIVIGEIYGKSLRRRDNGGSISTEGTSANVDASENSNVNNLLSVDASKIGEAAPFIMHSYAYPIQIVISIVGLYRLFGYAAFYGVFTMVLTLPVSYYVSKQFKERQSAVMNATDKRLKLMNELLTTIRIIKLFSWEKEFRKRMMDAREVELKTLYKRIFTLLWMMTIWLMAPILIMVVVFYVYTMDSALTASTAFTALALFIILRGALIELPFIVSIYLQAGVSLSRVEKFLAEEEVFPASQSAHPSGTYIGFVENAAFGWDRPASPTFSSNEPIIKNLNISFPQQKFSIVCGPTGCGKTTLLGSLLGETYCYSGRAILPRRPSLRDHQLGGSVSGIAYVAQTAWLQNCSIRDNILFGLEFDEVRYTKVLYMTALTKDLEILEFGDETEVGESGISLSGGQKQRVAIARAVYSYAETVILDDCLSAVDIHTAKHLYDHCLKGELMIGRTIILVTHYVDLCLEGADYIVALKDGCVEAAGNPLQVLESGVLGDPSTFAKNQHKDVMEEQIQQEPIQAKSQCIKATKSGDGSKLVKDETHAEGEVSRSVYSIYFFGAGGYAYWTIALFLFWLTESTFLAQDYWLKVWSGKYSDSGIPTPSISVASSGVLFVNDTVSMPFALPSTVYPVSGAALSPKDPQSVDVKYYLGVYFCIGMAGLVVAFVRMFMMYAGSIRASRRIHSQVLDRILRAKVRFFDTTPMGRIINRLSADLQIIDQDLSPQLVHLIFSIVSAMLIIILIVVVTPAFIIPGCLTTVVFWYTGIYYLKTSRDLKRLNSVSRSPIFVQFSECLSGVQTIRAYGCETRFIKDNFTYVDNNNRSFYWMWASNFWFHCRVDCLGAFVGFCTGSLLMLSRKWISPGLAGLALSYALNFAEHILATIQCYAMNEMNMNAVERVGEYLEIEEEAPTIIPETLPRESWPEGGTIKVDNLVVKYAPENPAVLRNISFSINAHEKVAIVGRTGSGKSTFALSLFRYMEATSGSILIDGVDISTIGLDTLRSRLTIIPQDPILFNGTIRSNLDPFDKYDDVVLWDALKRSHLVDNENDNISNNSDISGNLSSSEINLDTAVAEDGKNFSAGQRQLISLARALVKKSSLIVLDEATSSVDFNTDRKIQETIRSEFRDSTLVCIAHRLHTVSDYDRILVLDNGEVMEFDTPYNLMTTNGGVFQQMCQQSGRYSELLAMASR